VQGVGLGWSGWVVAVECVKDFPSGGCQGVGGRSQWSVLGGEVKGFRWRGT
jgi:hypothetical protein